MKKANKSSSAGTDVESSTNVDGLHVSQPIAKPNVIGSCWSFKSYTSALGDTGDYESCVEFTNGKDVLATSGDGVDDEECQRFCELLNLMPDLWSHRCDNTEFELSQSRNKNEFLERALKTIRDAFYTDGETDKEKVEDLKAIAFNALYEIENGLF